MNDTESVEERNHPPPRTDYDKPLGDLIRDLSRDAFRLVTQELDVARLEISRKVQGVKKNSVYLTVGAFVAYAGFLLILTGLVVELSSYIPLSLSAFMIGLAVLVTGLLLVQTGRKRIREETLTPPKAIRAFRSNGNG